MIHTIGFVGLGLMGSALTKNLLAEGFAVRGHDIDPDRLREFATRGGTPADSPAEAARGADVVMTSLMTGEIVAEVVKGRRGALETMRPGTILVDTSTVHPEASAALAVELAGRGIAMLDATLSGTSAQAQRRDLVVLVGGDPAVFERCLPIFKAIGRSVHHLGPNGAGARAKLVVNMVLGLNRLALAEGLTFGLKQGLDGPRLLEVLKDSAAYSRAMDHKGERMLDGRFEPEGKLSQHLKDVGLMLDLGQAHGVPLLLSAVHRQVLVAGVAAGRAEQDNACVIAVLRELAGIPFSESECEVLGAECRV
jgi:3-hydroxyisobutyrate dehydrogenase-like beta-hydroxyacid dehydrogenase